MTRTKKKRFWFKWKDPVKNPPKHNKQVLARVKGYEGSVVLVYSQETKIWRAPVHSETRYESNELKEWTDIPHSTEWTFAAIEEL